VPVVQCTPNIAVGSYIASNRSWIAPRTVSRPAASTVPVYRRRSTSPPKSRKQNTGSPSRWENIGGPVGKSWQFVAARTSSSIADILARTADIGTNTVCPP
jgi:hypothetical protein